jgi:hypothetical protein
MSRSIMDDFPLIRVADDPVGPPTQGRCRPGYHTAPSKPDKCAFSQS